jgi:hypothetical protein
MTRLFPLLLSVLFSASPSAPQQPSAPPQPSAAQQSPAAQQPSATQQPSARQMEAVLAKTRPGPEHEALRALAGRWNQEVTFDMGGPRKMIAKGTATNRLILGGRFLVSERTADNPAGAAAGIPTIEAVNIYGFDRRTSEYTILELDSMGTYWVSAAGPARPDGAIVMSGETLDDHSGQREVRRYDMVLKIVDADTYTTQIVFKFPDRPNLTIAEAVFRRIR